MPMQAFHIKIVSAYAIYVYGHYTIGRLKCKTMTQAGSRRILPAAQCGRRSAFVPRTPFAQILMVRAAHRMRMAAAPLMRRQRHAGWLSIFFVAGIAVYRSCCRAGHPCENFFCGVLLLWCQRLVLHHASLPRLVCAANASLPTEKPSNTKQHPSHSQ